MSEGTLKTRKKFRDDRKQKSTRLIPVSFYSLESITLRSSISFVARDVILSEDFSEKFSVQSDFGKTENVEWSIISIGGLKLDNMST